MSENQATNIPMQSKIATIITENRLCSNRGDDYDFLVTHFRKVLELKAVASLLHTGTALAMKVVQHFV